MNSKKIILDLCGGTGSWSRPYREAGYDVCLITLPDYDVNKAIIGNSHIHWHFGGGKQGPKDIEVGEYPLTTSK